MTNASPLIVRFRAFRDDDAQVWVATSDVGITAEATTKDDLLARLALIVPDVLDSRNLPVGHRLVVVEWQEWRTVDETTLAVA